MEEKIDWIQLMVEREALPKHMREGTVDDFCAKYGPARQTYYYQLAKDEVQQRVLETSLRFVKKYIPDALDKLGQKAVEGDNKAIEMLLEYVAKLSKNIDVKSDGKCIAILPSEIIDKNKND